MSRTLSVHAEPPPQGVLVSTVSLDGVQCAEAGASPLRLPAADEPAPIRLPTKGSERSNRVAATAAPCLPHCRHSRPFPANSLPRRFSFLTSIRAMPSREPVITEHRRVCS
ncbi:unnamed protein product [Heligmosomoides polygyrus]|uniref:Uncharacterized protein n=1 Tax=Heligmosomoides polygyrus TaxID=6339 RepID=A0A183F9K7_HELPZ|nr:unnamed protein product [Heligmosomoides polygyrus]